MLLIYNTKRKTIHFHPPYFALLAPKRKERNTSCINVEVFIMMNLQKNKSVKIGIEKFRSGNFSLKDEPFSGRPK